MTGTFVILLYHGVTTEVSVGGIENHSKKHLPADQFARQIALLKAEWNVVPFRELLTMKQADAIPPRTVVVTFDDGFENNYTAAFPILLEYGIPATFFFATGFIGTKKVFWVDKVEYLLNETSASAVAVDSLKTTFPLTSVAERIRAVDEIKSHLKRIPGLIDNTISQLESDLETRAAYDYPNYRMLSWEMVREMAESELCQIGAHTVDHPVLSHLERAEKQRQIEVSKATLAKEIAQDVDLFSYPEGQEDHFDGETVELLKKAGFCSSPTAVFGLNRVDISNFRLRRNMVGFTAPFDVCLHPSR